jgi:hypothetical protein
VARASRIEGRATSSSHRQTGPELSFAVQSPRKPRSFLLRKGHDQRVSLFLNQFLLQTHHHNLGIWDGDGDDRPGAHQFMTTQMGGFFVIPVELIKYRVG